MDSETPAHGQQVISASVFIHQNFDGIEKVFLPKRASTKKFLPDVYELPGGHIDFGEDIVTGLKREITEEFQMEIKVGDPFYVFTYRNQIKGSHSIEVIYFATFVTSINKIQLNPKDHSQFNWFTESNFHEAMTEKKMEDDQEFIAIRNGFNLLQGDSLNFG